jgi:hypothetical protein
MEKAIVSDFDTYGQASEIVRNLGLEGINGTEVELVSDADHDFRGFVNAKYASRRGPRRRILKEIGHFFHSLGTSDVHGGRTTVIVRTFDRNAERVSEMLRQRGGEIREAQD